MLEMESLKRIKIFNEFTQDTNLIDCAKSSQNETIELIGGIMKKNIDEIGFKSKCFTKYKHDEDELVKYLENGPNVIEGVFSCSKCKSKKIFTTSKQVRRADESTTVFAKCTDCKHCWVV